MINPTKAISRTFHPDNIDLLKFELRKINSKKYNSMNLLQQKQCIEFLEDCEKDIQQFKKYLKS